MGCVRSPFRPSHQMIRESRIARYCILRDNLTPDTTPFERPPRPQLN